MIIILEGADGCGKTSVSRLLHNTLPLSNLIKLSGAPKHVDSKEWMMEIYDSSAHFLIELGNKSHIILDRAWPSEWVYAPIFKGYDPDYIPTFQRSLHKQVDVHYVYLYTSPDVLHERMMNKRAIQPNEKHPEKDTIYRVVDAYDYWYDTFKGDFTATYYRINTDELYPQQVVEQIIEEVGLNVKEQDTTYSKVKYSLTGTKGSDVAKGFAIGDTVRTRGFEHVDDKFRKGEKGFIPERATKNSAGYDIRTPVNFTLMPNERVVIPTNIKAYMQPDEVLELHVRSSTGIKKHVVLSNSTGVLDADYYSNPDNDGNIMLALWNTGNDQVMFTRGDAICQGIFRKYLVADNDNATAERMGGIGSTSKGV